MVLHSLIAKPKLRSFGIESTTVTLSPSMSTAIALQALSGPFRSFAVLYCLAADVLVQIFEFRAPPKLPPKVI